MGVRASVVVAGRKLSAVVGDLSAEGLFVTLERGSQHAGGYGIHFPERDPAGRANPVGRFARISAHLQRSSLSQRLKVLKLRE